MITSPNAALHADAVRTLSGWAPDDPGQQALCQAFLGFLAARPDACARSCVPGHLTASAVVVTRRCIWTPTSRSSRRSMTSASSRGVTGSCSSRTRSPRSRRTDASPPPRTSPMPACTTSDSWRSGPRPDRSSAGGGSGYAATASSRSRKVSSSISGCLTRSRRTSSTPSCATRPVTSRTGTCTSARSAGPARATW